MANNGKKAEGYIQDALTLLERKRRASFVRLYDSTSAGFGSGGNLLPPTPADFIVVVNGVASLLEVKSSDKHVSLQDCTLRSVFSEHQIMSARVWKRAGSLALCAFHHTGSRLFAIWDMSVIVSAYLAPARQRKLTASPLIVCTTHPNELSTAIGEIICQPISLVTSTSGNDSLSQTRPQQPDGNMLSKRC